MMKPTLCVALSLMLAMVSSRPTATARSNKFEPEIKTATIIEVQEIEDPTFVFPPVPDLPADADTCKHRQQ